MAGRTWDEIPYRSWEDVTLRVDDDGQWHVRFDYVGANGRDYSYPEERISWDDFLDIYDAVLDEGKELEIEY